MTVKLFSVDMAILVWRLYVQFHQQVGLPNFGKQAVEPKVASDHQIPPLGQVNIRGSLPIETKPIPVQPQVTRASLPLQPQNKHFSDPDSHTVNHSQQYGSPGAHSPGGYGVHISPNYDIGHHSPGGAPTTQPHGFVMPPTHTTESVWYTPLQQPTSVPPVTFCGNSASCRDQSVCIGERGQSSETGYRNAQPKATGVLATTESPVHSTRKAGIRPNTADSISRHQFQPV